MVKLEVYLICILHITFIGCKLAKSSYENNSATNDIVNAALVAKYAPSKTNNKYFDLFFKNYGGPEGPIFVESSQIKPNVVRPLIEKGLSYVPNELQLWFLLHGGNIVLSERARDICKTHSSLSVYTQQFLLLYGNEEEFACLIFKFKDSLSFAIYIDITELQKPLSSEEQIKIEQKITKAVLKAFGFIIVDIIASIEKIEFEQRNNIIKFFYGKGDEIILQDIHELTWFFMEDALNYQISNNKQLKLFDVLDKFLGEWDDYKKIKDLTLSRQQRYEIWYNIRFYESKNPKDPKNELRRKLEYLEKWVFTEIFCYWYLGENIREKFLIVSDGKTLTNFDQLARKWNLHILPALEYIFNAINFDDMPRVYFNQEDADKQNSLFDLSGFGIYGDGYCAFARYPIGCGIFRAPAVVNKDKLFNFKYEIYDNLRFAINLNTTKQLWIYFSTIYQPLNYYISLFD